MVRHCFKAGSSGSLRETAHRGRLRGRAATRRALIATLEIVVNLTLRPVRTSPAGRRWRSASLPVRPVRQTYPEPHSRGALHLVPVGVTCRRCRSDVRLPTGPVSHQRGRHPRAPGRRRLRGGVRGTIECRKIKRHQRACRPAQPRPHEPDPRPDPARQFLPDRHTTTSGGSARLWLRKGFAFDEPGVGCSRRELPRIAELAGRCGGVDGYSPSPHRSGYDAA